jgi:hypothetical protein
MKSLGFLMLLAGWLIALSAVVLLGVTTPRAAFVLAGIAVEILGFVLIVRAHIPAGGAGN